MLLLQLVHHWDRGMVRDMGILGLLLQIFVLEGRIEAFCRSIPPLIFVNIFGFLWNSLKHTICMGVGDQL